jgi:TonB-dependent SusC/RagA subfamily outer membrane receptor
MKKYFKITVLAAFATLFTAAGIQAQDEATTVKGKVVDKSGGAIAGATVTYAKNKGVVTDENGAFTFNSKDSKGAFSVSYLGFKTQDIKVEDKNFSELLITLDEDEKQLSEVVVIGYGTSTKLKLTGSVTTLDARVLEQYSGKNVMDVLQGRVAGMYITQSSGLAGSAAKINIRGTNTLSGAIGGHGCCTSSTASTNTEPLIIIDGVPFINQSVSALDIGSVGALGPLSSLSVSDVERIDILKDADATAIYGSRGANGVILITTKRGV